MFPIKPAFPFRNCLSCLTYVLPLAAVAAMTSVLIKDSANGAKVPKVSSNLSTAITDDDRGSSKGSLSRNNEVGDMGGDDGVDDSSKYASQWAPFAEGPWDIGQRFPKLTGKMLQNHIKQTYVLGENRSFSWFLKDGHCLKVDLNPAAIVLLVVKRGLSGLINS
jgi:hypothetical protein